MHKKIIIYPKEINYKLKQEALKLSLLRNKNISVNDLIREYIEHGLKNTPKKQLCEES